MTETSGMLSLVSTPIGNLGDITLRALDVLKHADRILCEDTRTTGKLLKHYGITTPLESYHSHSTAKKHERIYEALRAGKHLALVSDAGTPVVSDPGSLLVRAVRADLPDVTITVIPGASALIAALTLLGEPLTDVRFIGFIPTKKGRETLFRMIAEYPHMIVAYESIHRLIKTLEASQTYFPLRKISIAREITKLHETLHQGTAEELLAYFAQHPDTVRGELVYIIHPA